MLPRKLFSSLRLETSGEAVNKGNHGLKRVIKETTVFGIATHRRFPGKDISSREDMDFPGKDMGSMEDIGFAALRQPTDGILGGKKDTYTISAKLLRKQEPRN